jgi:CheY-like chemotaxis protein
MKKKLNCVLLIDDDEPTNYLNKMILNQMDCTSHIKVAQSGKEAIEFLKAAANRFNGEGCQPELIFLDINMPAMDGWEFIELYKKHIPDRHIIMVMLTTSLNPDDRQIAEEMKEIAGFINKPLTKKAVQEILDSYFINNDN